jgi:hypothetical protein
MYWQAQARLQFQNSSIPAEGGASRPFFQAEPMSTGVIYPWDRTLFGNNRALAPAVVLHSWVRSAFAALFLHMRPPASHTFSAHRLS